jgi:hypothetical protein
MSLSNMPVSTLFGVGAQMEGLAQEEAAYLANQNMWNLNAPWAPLQNYANIVYGGASPSTTSTSSGELRVTGTLERWYALVQKPVSVRLQKQLYGALLLVTFGLSLLFIRS